MSRYEKVIYQSSYRMHVRMYGDVAIVTALRFKSSLLL